MTTPLKPSTPRIFPFITTGERDAGRFAESIFGSATWATGAGRSGPQTEGGRSLLKCAGRRRLLRGRRRAGGRETFPEGGRGGAGLVERCQSCGKEKDPRQKRSARAVRRSRVPPWFRR